MPLITPKSPSGNGPLRDDTERELSVVGSRYSDSISSKDPIHGQGEYSFDYVCPRKCFLNLYIYRQQLSTNLVKAVRKRNIG